MGRARGQVGREDVQRRPIDSRQMRQVTHDTAMLVSLLDEGEARLDCCLYLTYLYYTMVLLYSSCFLNALLCTNTTSSINVSGGPSVSPVSDLISDLPLPI